MLASDELSIIPYMRLAPEERLDLIDFLAATISNLAFDVAGIGDAQIIRSLLDICLMLTVMREDLATDCSSTNMTIISNAASLIQAMKARCEGRRSAWTVH